MDNLFTSDFFERLEQRMNAPRRRSARPRNAETELKRIRDELFNEVIWPLEVMATCHTDVSEENRKNAAAWAEKIRAIVWGHKHG